MVERADVLIVGAGHGGAHAAIALRQLGFEGTIRLVGDEPDPPYERPPLSKEYLAGERPSERLALRPLEFWAKRDIMLSLGTQIIAVEADAHLARTEDGRSISFGHLIWAAGGYPRSLPVEGSRLSGVCMLRSRQDADEIRLRAADARSVVIIGGGYIGLEAAAVLSKMGKAVTILEAQSRVLARVAAEPISRFYEDAHRSQGVEVRTDVVVESILGKGGAVTDVVLATGERVPAQLVLVGVGLEPNQEVMAKAGARCSNGVVVDAYCRTNLPDILAIGDCAAHPSPYAEGDLVRIESVQNATDQAKTAALSILGKLEPYSAVPWFWSNQYDLKLQTAGLHYGYDETIIRGDPADGRFSLIYLRHGRMIAIDCINSVADFVAGKLLVAQRPPADRTALADRNVPLKSLLD
jgi:3-phenylpropionate/trans-cinnamate dioxygenase ferredoxin reductase subunit